MINRMKGMILVVMMFFVSYGLVSADQYHYFYKVGCSHCIKVAEYFEDSEADRQFALKKYDLADREALELLKGFLEKMEVPLSSVGTPIMVIEDEAGLLSYLVSSAPIITYFEDLQSGQVGNVQLQTGSMVDKGLDGYAVHEPLKFLGVMVPMAIADSINPCAFAVMLLLLSTIFSKSKSRKRTILAGLLFSLAIFISYFLIGIGVFKLLGTTAVTQGFKRVIGILGIIIGLANIKDYFWYGEGFLMEVPMAWRPRMMKLIQGVVSPVGAFFIGILVSLFLLPCSSGPYLVILGLLKSENVGVSSLGIGYLVLYNLLFILPMLVITLLVGSGQASVEKLAKLKNKNTKLIHLIVGIAMLLLGGYVISTIYVAF